MLPAYNSCVPAIEDGHECRKVFELLYPGLMWE